MDSNPTNLINHADDAELAEIIQAIIHRYNSLHPDSEIFFLSLPRNNPQERQETIDALIRSLQTQK